jgi:hypothetical protein
LGLDPMTPTYEDDELPLPLLRRSQPKSAGRLASETVPRRDYREGRTRDRLRPGTAGALAGLAAGCAALGVIHAVHLMPISRSAARLAAALGLAPDAALPGAYVAAAAGGALLGAGFATLTRHLRRFVPLTAWAVVFFACLALLGLALSAAYGRGAGVTMAPAILLASVAYALVVSLQLPLRKRS